MNVVFCEDLKSTISENYKLYPTTPLTKKTKPPNTTATLSTDATTSNIITESLNQEKETDLVSWDIFVDILTAISLEQLINIKNNIKNNYNLKAPDVHEIEQAFNNTDYDYQYLIQHKLKKLVENNKYNNSEQFLIDCMDLSNVVVEKIVEFGLLKAKSALSYPTSWHKQTLKDKIFRQQVKGSFATIEIQICNTVSVCKEKKLYSDYVIDWLRFLLKEKSLVLQEFFKMFPVILPSYADLIITSSSFRKNMEYATKIQAMGQRDILDYVDEVIVNPDFIQVVPDPLIKCTLLLQDLFKALNDYYELTDANTEQLETITQMFAIWSGSTTGVKEILDAILRNMQLNFKTWPRNKQNRIKNLWNEIIFL